MKKFLSFFLALVMVFAMMSFAAADAGTFTGVGDGKIFPRKRLPQDVALVVVKNLQNGGEKDDQHDHFQSF